MKKKSRKIIKIAAVTILSIFVLQAGYMTYSMAVGKVNEESDPQKVTEAVENRQVRIDEAKKIEPINIDNLPKPQRPPKKEFDISGVDISSEIEKKIIEKDSKNSDRNIKNYKKLLIEFDVPQSFKEVVEKLIEKGYEIPDICIAYEFLNENYGQIDELDMLLSQKESKRSWADIFKEYNGKHAVFVPRNFEFGYLENLLKTTDITGDDVMIADKLSQNGIKDFDELIELKKKGTDWKAINTELGVVNVAEKLPRMTMTSVQVKKYMEQTGLSKEEVIEALTIAWKMEKDDEEIISKVMEGKTKGESATVTSKTGVGKTKEDIYAELFEEKYK